MNLTQILAIIGAVTGVASLAWNIYVKLSAGPKLSVKVWPGMVMMPTPPDDPRFIRVTVRNTGTASTTLTTLGFHAYESKKRARKLKPDKSFVVIETLGEPMPFKLEIGGEWNGYVKQDEVMDQMIAAGTLWCAVYHSFAGETPEQTPVVKITPTKTAPKRAASAS